MKPSLPKGTRDFSPLETARRRYIFETIREAFELYGYQSLETPAMENLSTLTGKYGEEGDRLIFKILNSGDFLEEVRNQQSDLSAPNKVLPLISEKALRYDLTVPFARYVAMNRDKLAFPFRRYQMQPVWRADRPQKGRYREFWQCDADVVGSASLLNEAELIQIYDRVFTAFRLPVRILINNRKVLSGLAEVIGEPERLIDITVAIDKLDKIGVEKVEQEMRDKGVSESAIEKLRPLFTISGSITEKTAFLKDFLADSVVGKQGIQELETLVGYFEGQDALQLATSSLELDLTLARGLNYYTGTILEVKSRDVAFGSIGGGGRYDDLTGIFGLPGVPGVGISFGADRIYDVLLMQDLFPSSAVTGTEVLFANFTSEDERAALPLLQQLRNAGVKAEIYPETSKLKKQFEYAEKKGIPYLMIFGEGERAEQMVLTKQLASGKQLPIPLKDLNRFAELFA
ncbi:MAG: Histidine-tRNA ligase [Bacteroidota bacterium]|jgi:histidyl-tRNA synthetase